MEESCPQEKTGMRCTVGKLGSSCCVVPAGVTVFRCGGGGVGKRNDAHQHFCRCRSLAKIPPPPGQTLRLVKNSLSSTYQIFSNCCLHAVAPSSGCLLYCVFKGRDSVSYHPLGSPRAEPADF